MSAGLVDFVVNHAELVHQNFLGFASGVQRVGVDRAVQRGEQELIRKHRELNRELSKVLDRHVAVRKPGGVLVLLHHGMTHEFVFNGLLERDEVFPCHDSSSYFNQLNGYCSSSNATACVVSFNGWNVSTMTASSSVRVLPIDPS